MSHHMNVRQKRDKYVLEIMDIFHSNKIVVVNYSQGVVNDATLPAPLTG